MRFGTAIERLVDNYRYAKGKAWIRDEVAWALYQTWKEADRKTENSSEIPNNCEPQICDICRYYNRNIPCGSTPSACKEADKFAEEFVDGLKKLKPKVEPTISKMEQVEEPMKTTDYCDICKRDMCEDCVADATNPYCVPSLYEINYEPKDEPQTSGTPYKIDTSSVCKGEPQNGYQTFSGTSVYVSRFEDEPQTERSE